MRFLADENLDFAVVRALRGAGHEVRALAEETSRTIDSEVIALAWHHAGAWPARLELSRAERRLPAELPRCGWLTARGRRPGSG